MPIWGYSQEQIDLARQAAYEGGRQAALNEIYLTLDRLLGQRTDYDMLYRLFQLWGGQRSGSAAALANGFARLVADLDVARAAFAAIQAEYNRLVDAQADPAALERLRQELKTCQRERDEAQRLLTLRGSQWEAERRALEQIVRTHKEEMAEYELAIVLDGSARR
ncbi:MAG: hypothetical protein JW934_19405 [Anaerolineae bacterium]|nr:hypothetical protein [Anaerolineae bacterium]